MNCKRRNSASAHATPVLIQDALPLKLSERTDRAVNHEEGRVEVVDYPRCFRKHHHVISVVFNSGDRAYQTYAHYE